MINERDGGRVAKELLGPKQTQFFEDAYSKGLRLSAWGIAHELAVEVTNTTTASQCTHS